jgi:biopolymer transport protein ExbB/TolQ
MQRHCDRIPGIGIVADSALAAVMASGAVTVAFITTAAGLLVAIPATWSYNYLRTRIDLLQLKSLATCL